MNAVAARIDRRRKTCPGLALLEVLIALLLLGLGSLSLLRLQAGLQSGADLARQQTEAARQAADALEDPQEQATAPIGTALADAELVHERRLSPAALPRLQQLDSQIGWTDRNGQVHVLSLSGLQLQISADLGAATLLPRPTTGSTGASGGTIGVAESPWLPRGSQDLGDGRQAWRVRPDASLIWILDRATAAVTERCEADPPPAGTPDRLEPGRLGRCRLLSGLLLSGHIRFATATDTPGTPEAEQPDSPALALRLRFTPTSALATSPGWECVHDGPQAGAAPDPARTSIAYHCVIQAAMVAGVARWSGRLDLVPDGWLLADSSATAGASGRHRICRYSADHDGNGRIDAAEHPAVWTAVSLPLAGQNFLVIRATGRCPVDLGPWPWPDPVDDSTAAHQP